MKITNEISENLKYLDLRGTNVSADFIRMYQKYDGFMFDISGRDDNDDWSDAKVLCPTVDDVVKLINEVVKLPRD